MQAQAKKAAPKSAPKTAKKTKPFSLSSSDSEEEFADKEDDSSSESASSDLEAADKSAKASKSVTCTPRTVQASSKKAAKAIAAACVNLDEDASDSEDLPNTPDSEAENGPNESSPAAAGTIAQMQSTQVSSQKKKNASPPHDFHDGTAKLDNKGSKSSSPEGTCRKSLGKGPKNKPAANTDDSPVSQAANEPAESADESEAASEAESPVPVMLKSRKLQKADGSAVQTKGAEDNRGE